MLQALENWAATKPAGAELDSGRLAALTLNVARPQEPDRLIE